MIAEYTQELKKIYYKYPKIHSELTELENIIKDVSDKWHTLGQELEDTRNAERILINKIEESIDRKLTHEDLIQMMQHDTQR